MKSAELDYELPQGLIAQRPLERRDESRLLVFDRGTGEVEHRRFGELPELLPRETLTVVNDTRVLPARLRLARAGGGGGGGCGTRGDWFSRGWGRGWRAGRGGSGGGSGWGRGTASSRWARDAGA